MSVTSSNLNRLLRLLKDDLPADAADRLRERLREDTELAAQYQTLRDMEDQVLTAETLVEHEDAIDPDAIAEFVEGGMSPERQVAFERRCWESQSLLREVVAAWHATQDVMWHEAEPESLGKASAVVHDLFASMPTDSLNAEVTPPASQPQPEADGETAPTGVNGQGSEEHPRFLPNAQVAPMSQGDPRRNGVRQTDGARNGVVVVPRRPARSRTRRAAQAWIVVGGIAVVLLALMLRMLSQAGPERMAQPGDQPGPEQEPQMVHDGTVPDEIREDENPQTPLPERENESDRESLVHDGGATEADDTLQQPREGADLVQDRTPRESVPDTPAPPTPRPPNKPQVTLVAWSQIDGIVGDKTTEETVWGGIHSRSAADLWHSQVRSQLVTMPNSRASGTMAGGMQIIADADSLIEMGAADVGDPQRKDETAEAIMPVVAVQRGRLAIDGLYSGQRIQLQVDSRRIEIQATADESTLAIERVAGETVVAAYRGTLQAGGQSITRRAWKRVDGAGTMTSFQPQRPVEWYRKSGRASSIPIKTCTAFNTAPDLVQLAESMEASQNARDSAIAVQVALRCLISKDQPMTVGLARRLLNSKQASHGQELIEWLVTRYRQDVAGGEADLRVVCRILQTPPKTTIAMSGWFQTAVAGQPPSRVQLGELLAHLRNTSPVFARRCSKYFLQHLLNDPLTEYDPAKAPTRAALSSVTQKVRRWEVANP